MRENTISILILIIAILIIFLSVAIQNNSPCSNFASSSIQYIPARCFKYFQINK